MTRGPRGPDSQARRYKRWGQTQDKVRIKEAIERDLVIHKIKTFPADFIHFSTSGEQVREVVRTKFSTTSSPEQLLQLPTRGKLLVPLDHLPQETVPAEMPPYLIIRLEHFLTDDQQAGLLARWDRFIASKPRHILKPDANRSTSEAFHLGVWEITANKPRLTLESRDQSPEAVEAMDNLLRFIKTYIAPKIATVFKEHAPIQWECILKANARVLRLLKHDLKLRPDLFMGGPFFAVAAKEAGSGIVHLDWNDDRAIYAFVFAVGDWEGGEFCAPQLGIKIPIRPGQVLVVLARVLAHFSAPVTSGRRVVFTCFTDRLLFRHGCPEVMVFSC
ncbi:hypothetical protein CY34DRAFT_19277 [Suillus luteus UH-Slu-Lm8-n1]|uniref:Uncharacterized protein n=1 Tax=Suillus luteus UH-Slu-Lm8-n1 TaxID=930992 RepID=A0A0D0A1T8_9AGAM|nr:hypothetical protein CY34DRAFT_19277 [Suillus luteus UH-Slu-Lm8-n1]